MSRNVLVVVIAAAAPFMPLSASAQIPLPPDVKIVAASPDVPKNLAVFVGKWEGNWSNRLPAVIIVEEVSAEKATVIYAWGDSQEWKITQGYGRSREAKIIPGDKPEIHGAVLRLRMGSDENSLFVTRVTPRTVDSETFKRVSP